MAGGNETLAAADATLPGASASAQSGAAAAASSSAGAVSGRLTHHGAVMGSSLYMAPEQWTDAAAASPQTDLYALGVLAYEALTGQPPFQAASQLKLAQAHARELPPPLGGGLPVELDAVLARALAKQPADRHGSALELAAAFRVASGIAAEPVGLPRLDDGIRAGAIAGAPQPLAQAVAALDAARNPHQAIAAVWQVSRVAIRLVGLVALASHAHVGAGTTDPLVADALRRLRGRGIGDEAWLEVARALTRRFVGLRDAHPVPELIDLLRGGGAAPLDELCARRAVAEQAASEGAIRELLEQAVPLVAAALGALDFLLDYALVVADERGAAAWMGGHGRRARIAVAGRPLEAGHPALVDGAGVPVVDLWPFVQAQSPSPGAPATLFLFDGKGRRGAHLIALPDAFELDDEALWESFGGMLGDTGESTGRTSAEERCPFPGLAAFSQEDAGSFFGRERESEAFVNRLRVQPLLAVVGPSGAGKSSFIQAGVIPALPEGWECITVRPGPAPLVSLAARLASAGLDTVGLRADLDEHPGALGTLLRAAAAARGQTLVLVVDQLEELFTLCDDPAERALYADALVRAARSADDPVRVVVTLRDDFLLHAEALPPFRSRLGLGLQLLTTPDRADLRRILTEPLRQVGYELDDPALADEMVEAVAERPGALALLSFTAAQLWELRDRRFRHLSRKAHDSLGGVGGALAQHAEATLKAMHPEEQRLCREVFRHLVTAEGTRAVLSRGELDDVLGGGAHAGAMLEKLVAARLLVVAEGEGGSERIEVTHEALLDAWPRLVAWRRQDAEGARLRDQLRAAARQWEERGRPSGLLWRGDALAEYRLWRSRQPGALTASEEAFAAASLADASRGARRRRAAIGGAFAALLAGLVVVLFMNARVARQRAAAEEHRVRAEENEREAEAGKQKLHELLLGQYESQGRRLVLSGDPLQGLAYLAKAGEMGARGPAHELAVAQALHMTEGELFRVEHDSSIREAHFIAGGSRLLTTSFDQTARLWDADSGALLHTLEHDATVVDAALDPSGAIVFTVTQTGSLWRWDVAGGGVLGRHDDLGGRIARATFTADSGRAVLLVDQGARLVEPATGRTIATYDGARRAGVAAEGQVAALAGDRDVEVVSLEDGRRRQLLRGAGGVGRAIALSPGGRLVAVTTGNVAAVWQVASGRRLYVVEHRDRINAVAFDPLGRWLATGAEDRTAVVWELASGIRLRTLEGHAAPITDLRFSPDGAVLATASDDATALLWDPASGQRLARRFGHRASLRRLSFDDRGTRLVTVGEDQTAIVWRSIRQPPVRRLLGHRGAVASARMSPDGERLVSAGEDGTARIWDVAGGRELVQLDGGGGPLERAVFDPDGRRVATASNDGKVRIWDAEGRLLRTLSGHRGTVYTVAWDPAGREVLTAGVDGTVRLWSEAGEEVRTIDGHGGREVFVAAFVPGRDAIATVGDDATVRLWDRASGRALAVFRDPDTRITLSFDPRAEYAVSSSLSESVKVWRVADGQVVTEFTGQMRAVPTVEWSPDGTLVLTSNYGGSASVWDPERGEIVARFDHHRDGVWTASFSPDGRRIVTASRDGEIAVVDLPRHDPADLPRLLRCRVPYIIAGDEVVSRRRDPSACDP
jgi:WD40 repeat protein